MVANWTLVEEKVNKFYEEYAKKRCLLLTKNMTIAERSCRQAYFPSVVETANPKRKGKEFDSSNRKINEVISNIIAPFLNNEDYSKNTCYKTIKKIRNSFRNQNNEYPFTYGNAQKWLTISMKYYIAHLYHQDCTNGYISFENFLNQHHSFNSYRLFPVDNIIERKITNEFSISFPCNCKWHDCDDIKHFKKYWDNVESQVVDYIPFCWEYIAW